jgi:hypothetical protein
VYVPEGLPEGEHEAQFGGVFGINTTYTLIAV